MLLSFIQGDAHAEYGAELSRPLFVPRPAVTSPDARADAPLRNRLLTALSLEQQLEVDPFLERIWVERRQSLFEADEPIRHVYFPETTVVSVVSHMEQGGTVEVGTAGFEGMAGLPLFLGDQSSSVRAIAQIAGSATRMDAEAFVRLAGAAGPFHRILLRYTLAFLTQVAQTAACNGAHLVHERCARWLLMTHDRVNGREFPLTHEFLAFMLGVRRAGVTMAMRGLQDEGLVRYTRGRVEIVDREGLEGASCECYRVVRNHTNRLLPRSA